MSSSTRTREAYEGAQRSLIIAIDVGTTFSGASYCVLDPGNPPVVEGVHKYPGQTNNGTGGKIPTVIWYTSDGEVYGAGAEKRLEKHKGKPTISQEDLVKVEWFKVHMRPKALEKAQMEYSVSPLPFGKSVEDVFGDFLAYIYGCIEDYFKTSRAHGQSMWDSFDDRITFVLTHPNGYEVREQALMRKAAVKGKLVPNEEVAKTRVQLVTEGEASLHYCLDSGLADEALKGGNAVMIIDAGGGTVDFSAYAEKDDGYEEVAPTDCVYEGSVFITRRAETEIQSRLEGSEFAADLKDIIDVFDKETKLEFEDPEEDYKIRFGGRNDNDEERGIRKGELTLKGEEMTGFFEPAVSKIVATALDQVDIAKKDILSIFLVGGFSSNGWLFSALREEFKPMGLDVSRPDRQLSKAVADGAALFALDHRVKARISKFTYGVSCKRPYDPEDPSHFKRSHEAVEGPDGRLYLRRGFDIILPRNTQVAETTEFRRPFSRSSEDIDDLKTVSSQILEYRGDGLPQWIEDDQKHLFAPLCTITADMSRLCDSLQPARARGKTFYRIRYEFALHFGLTEFKAQAVWQENDLERRSDTTAVCPDQH